MQIFTSMKLTNITKFTLLFTAIAIAFGACKSEEKLTLKFAPEVSKKYEMTMTYVQDMDMGQMGKMENNIGMTYDMLVKEKDENKNTVILTTFKKITFIAKTPQGELGYESDKAVDSSNMFSVMFSKVFGGMLNQSIFITVDEKGKVTDVKGMEEIFNNIIKSSGLDTLPGGAESIAGFKDQFSNEQFKKNFDESFHILPEKEVTVGDTWEIDNKKNMMDMDMVTKNKYTLKEIKGDYIIVDVVSEFSADKKEGGSIPGEMKMDGTQSGTMKIDRSTGLAVESELKQKVNSTSKMMGQEIPMTIDGTVKISSKEIK